MMLASWGPMIQIGLADAHDVGAKRPNGPNRVVQIGLADAHDAPTRPG